MDEDLNDCVFRQLVKLVDVKALGAYLRGLRRQSSLSERLDDQRSSDIRIARHRPPLGKTRARLRVPRRLRLADRSPSLATCWRIRGDRWFDILLFHFLPHGQTRTKAWRAGAYWRSRRAGL